MSSEPDIHKIFHTLDNPKRILFWTLNEVLLVFLFFLLGIVFNMLIFLLVFPINAVYRRLKRKFPKSSFRHKLYWHVPHVIFIKSGRLKNLPPSYIRDLIL